jgi:hypothetical protein
MRRPYPTARKTLTILLFLGCLAVPSSVVAAAVQSGTVQEGNAPSSVQGQVLDPSRGAIVGARVTATAGDRSAGPSSLTDDRGEFTLTLPSGRYTISVTAPGFVGASQSLNVSQSRTQVPEFVLQLAGVREAVTVSAPEGYRQSTISSATRTLTPLSEVPQSVTVVTRELMKDQLMTSVSDVVRYVPGITAHQGENNRDQIIVRGNNTSADFFVNGVRDDVQYFRDIYTSTTSSVSRR